GGDTAVVGAVGDDSFRGSAYVFLRSGKTWSEQQKLTAFGGAAGDFFGHSIAIDGDTVGVGAPDVKIGANEVQGVGYFFLRSGTIWSEQQKLMALNGAAFDQFGGSVAIDGDTVAVGANGDDSFRGAAYVFISCPEIIINPTDHALPEGTVGQPYIQAFTASAGTTPLRFTVIRGALPPGLNLDQDGTLSGAPTSADTFNFTVQATDAKGCTGTHDYTLVINSSTCPTITVYPEALPVGTPNLAYNNILDASGGTAPHSFSVLSGSLPPDLRLSTTGILSGTPTAAGVFNLTVLATDATGCAGARAYTLAIAPSGFATVSAASFEFPVTAKEIVAGFGVSGANPTAAANA